VGRRAFVREQILDAAFTLFAREGYEAVSTRDIAKAAEVGPASMYRHFPSKDDLGREVYRRALGPLNERLCRPLHDQEKDPKQQAKAFVETLYASYDDSPKALALLVFPPHVFTPDECRHDRPGTVRHSLADWLRRTEEANADDQAAFFWGAVTGPIIDRYLHQRAGTMLEQAPPIITLALRLLSED
jgi:AcrR family transcriptional regulator